MQLPLQITFRDMDPSPALEARIREAAAKLESHFDRITSCRVAVESPHRHHHHGAHYRVRIDLAIPGHEIVVGRSPTEKDAHADAYVAIRDAFRAARRTLEDQVRMGRRRQQAHRALRNGRAEPRA